MTIAMATGWNVLGSHEDQITEVGRYEFGTHYATQHGLRFFQTQHGLRFFHRGSRIVAGSFAQVTSDLYLMAKMSGSV